MNLDDTFLRKQNIKMSFFKKDKIHLSKKGSKAWAKEIKYQLSYL